MPEHRWDTKKNQRFIRKNFTLAPGDIELLKWLSDYMESSEAEAMRTALRAYVAHLQSLEKEIGRPRG